MAATALGLLLGGVGAIAVGGLAVSQMGKFTKPDLPSKGGPTGMGSSGMNGPAGSGNNVYIDNRNYELNNSGESTYGDSKRAENWVKGVNESEDIQNTPIEMRESDT
jgi:hypothetical protein